MLSEPPLPTLSLSRQAADLAADLMRPKAWIYWLDLCVTATVLYAALWLAMTLAAPFAWPAGLVAALALYRAISFIHELTHQRRDQLPGFHAGWNLLIGVPFLTPSFLYEGVHQLHHAKDRYGTARDPEYHPLARRPLGELAAFLGVALLAPLGVFLRFGVLAPLGFVIPPVRRFAIAKASGMVINTGFAREDFDRAARAPWLAQEIACWLWSWTLIAMVAAGVMPVRAFLIALAVFAAMTFINQLRTAVAHYWENDGEPMSFEAQFADTVNVPPPALLPVIWAPVGLRYHALHHLLPRTPYHNLGEAHRRLVAALPPGGLYDQVAQPELAPALGRLIRRARASQGA
ncbi:fatty acid desaturase family protein [Phenylobacterium immobile]|uniref:fatty acid desaturase family protein n=1 Tax=Phenylobacterium immobile TaxID=21 RepID=UPI000A9C1D3F|nr:fatty acid desaturase [Phenylobacterium immobile]